MEFHARPRIGKTRPCLTNSSQISTGNSDENPWGNSVRRTEQIDGLPSIAPVTPTSNWGPPASTGIGWQTANSGSWASENSPGSGAAGSGFDSGASLFREGQNLDPRVPVPDRNPAGIPATSGRSSGPQTPSRQYNGVWPNANARGPAQPQNGGTNLNSNDGRDGFGNAAARQRDGGIDADRRLVVRQGVGHHVTICVWYVPEE